MLLVFLEYDWTYCIVEHGRNFTPAVAFGFLYDEEFAKDVLFKFSTFSRAQLLCDCSTQMNLTTRGGWTGEKVEEALILLMKTMLVLYVGYRKLKLARNFGFNFQKCMNKYTVTVRTQTNF